MAISEKLQDGNGHEKPVTDEGQEENSDALKAYIVG